MLTEPHRIESIPDKQNRIIQQQRAFIQELIRDKRFLLDRVEWLNGRVEWYKTELQVVQEGAK